ncbi:ANTAR domain-containing protein [Dermatophilaceae bacterium Soc4.6]
MPSASRSVPPDELETAQVDALRVMTADELCHEVVTLRRAVVSNRQIGASVGVVMHERGLGYDEALALLRRLSQDTNVPLVQVAETVLRLGHLGS